MSVLFQSHRVAYYENLIGTTQPLININFVSFISYARELKDSDNLGTIPYEIDRKEINTTDMSFSGKIFTLNLDIGSSECVCPTSEIQSKDSTSTIITLDSGTSSSFEVNNLIEVETEGGFIESKIIAKTGDDITIDNPRNATIGGLIRKKVSHLILLCNATSTRNTGDMMFLSFENSFFKDSTAPLTKKLTFDLNI